MKNNTRVMVGTAILSAIVVVLQIVGSFIHFGVFSISLVLAPIIIGSAMYGVASGGILGLVFGITVLLSGDAAAFLTVNPVGTVVTVLVKGVVAGLAAGAVYKLLAKVNDLLAVIVAGVVAPVCNTGVFLIGCRLFFYATIQQWGTAAGFDNVAKYMFVGLAGVNFVVELAINMVLAAAIVKIINVGKKQSNKQ